ncbi:MAG: putative Ig domain-containing protein, partial [Clostridia bacterium]
TAPVLWAPTITSSSSGNDTVCFMDPYVYEFSANETVTWELVSVTPPAGGNATWLDMKDEFLAGVPFPICGPDGIGEYEVSVKATSTEGTLSSYQNFTLTVTADRSGFDLYETFGDLVIETQQPGLYGWGTAVQNATLTWDVNDTELYYGGFDADELTGYGWELHTVAMTDPELVFVLAHNDTERTYGIYGKDDLEALNGTAAIQYLDARIEVEDSVIYARLLDINISAYYFGITGITVNGASVTLPEFELPGELNATFIVSTTLDWLEEEYGYDVQTVSIGLSSTDFQSWIGGDAANSTAIFQLTDAYGDYWLNWTMRILDGETVLARAHLATLLTIREPYAPEITSTAMAKAYVGEEYSFTFAAVETDLFILQYPVPSWATWDNATGTFTGTPEVGDLGVYMIVVYPYNTTDGITGDPFYAQFIVRPAAEAGDGIGFFGYVFSSIIALLFCIFLSISKDGFNATVFMALVPMAIAVLISVGAMPLWTIIVGILFYGILIFRNVGPGDSL